MFYVMKSYRDEWGHLYERAFRKAPYASFEQACKVAEEKVGKGAFVINNKRKVEFVCR